MLAQLQKESIDLEKEANASPPTMTSKDPEKARVERMLAQLQKESIDLEKEANASPPTMTSKDPEKARVEKMLAQLQKESMELEKADAPPQVPQQQNAADREAARIQKMLATIQQETKIMEQKMDERRGGQQQQQSGGGNNGKEDPSEASSWSASSDSYVSLEKHHHTARKEEKDFDSSYESFEHLSAAKRISAEEPAFKSKKKKDVADLAPTVKDKSNDPEVRQQLEMLAEKIKEIGINPEEIGINLDDTPDEILVEAEEARPGQGHELHTRPQGVAVSSLPDVANQLAMAQQMCISKVSGRGHTQPPGDVPDAANQMAMAQQMVLARLRANAKQTAGNESKQRSHRRTNSKDRLRSGSGRLVAPSTDDNRESTKDGRPLDRVGERPDKGEWLYRQLSFKSDRSNKSTPSTTINVGLFIDDSPSVRNILPITSVHMPGSSRHRPPRPVWDDDYASSSSYSSSSSSYSSSSSSSSSSYFNAIVPKTQDTPVEDMNKGGMRPMRGNRISYKSLNDFIEEHNPNDKIASDKGSSKMGSSRGAKSAGSNRSFRSNRHSFKDLTDYDDECKTKEKVLSTTTDRTIYATFADDGSKRSESGERTSDELFVMTPSRGSYKKLNLLIEEHGQVPDPRLDNDNVGPSRSDPKPVEPPVRSISVPSLGGESFEDDDDISGLFPLTQADVELRDSESRTRGSADPPEKQVVSLKPTPEMSLSARNQIETRNVDPTRGEDGIIHKAAANTSHVGSGARHNTTDGRARSDNHKSPDDSFGGVVKKREKSRSKSPLKSSRHDSNERLKELSSRKEEKEKALRKLLEKSSVHSQHRRHSLDLQIPMKAFSNDNSSSEGRHQKARSSRSQEFEISPRKDKSRHNGHREKVDNSQRHRSNRSGSPERGKSRCKDESRSRSRSKHDSRSSLNMSSSSRIDVKSSSKHTSRRGLNNSRSSIDAKSSSKHASQRSFENSRSSIDAKSSSKHGRDRSKEKKLKKTGHCFDLESLAPSKKKSSDDKEKKKGKSMKSKSKSSHERTSRHARHRSTSREDKKDDKKKKKKKDKKKKDKRKDKDDDYYKKDKKKDKKKSEEKKSSYSSPSHHQNKDKCHHSDSRHDERKKSSKSKSKSKSSRSSSSSKEVNVDAALEPFQRLLR
mmetsp:Transcript_56393/g.136821  ORF Transcript_56393/g.136821 Transcript_56393/m.136821 type:complete len:1140 (+) Transcript_56393:2-3421(+)